MTALAIGFVAHSSSNPLDVGSEDPWNSQYKRAYDDEKGDMRDSDDVGSGPTRAYQRHVHDLRKQRTTPTDSHAAFYLQNPGGFIDLDAEMDDEEEQEVACGVAEVGDAVGEGEGGELDMNEGEMVEEEEEGEEEEDSSDGEEYTLNSKPEEEQHEIEAQMRSLELAVPLLTEDYRLVDRLGTGTFSTVFKAVDLHHHSKWDNALWIQPHRPSGKTFVAIKRIYVTSAPDRIRNEIAIMETCRGARFVSQIITAFRERDQIVLVLPYQRNDDFRVCSVCFANTGCVSKTRLGARIFSALCLWRESRHTSDVCSVRYATFMRVASSTATLSRQISSLTHAPESVPCAISVSHVCVYRLGVSTSSLTRASEINRPRVEYGTMSACPGDALTSAWAGAPSRGDVGH
jgi:hypothetical protein